MSLRAGLTRDHVRFGRELQDITSSVGGSSDGIIRLGILSKRPEALAMATGLVVQSRGCCLEASCAWPARLTSVPLPLVSSLNSCDLGGRGEPASRTVGAYLVFSAPDLLSSSAMTEAASEQNGRSCCRLRGSHASDLFHYGFTQSLGSCRVYGSSGSSPSLGSRRGVWRR